MKSLIALFSILLTPHLAAAGSSDTALCFDFSKPVLKPLQDSVAFGPANQDAVVSGLHPRGGGWAAARASLPLSIEQLLELLKDPKTLKNPRDCELEFKKEDRPDFIEFQTVDITIHPFPLISIRWSEQWAFTMLEGTRDKPSKVLISYQKSSGTEHIRRYCGNILLTSIQPTQTDIALYEETDATRRSAADIARGHEGTLRTLRASQRP